eukprot:m.336233 g.336233  ORF g.336233 m.336233 type:complete len:694 (-) comp17791_c0_seq1:88-2169(-)
MAGPREREGDGDTAPKKEAPSGNNQTQLMSMLLFLAVIAIANIVVTVIMHRSNEEFKIVSGSYESKLMELSKQELVEKIVDMRAKLSTASTATRQSSGSKTESRRTATVATQDSKVVSDPISEPEDGLESLRPLALPNDDKLALIKEHEDVRLKALDKPRSVAEQKQHEDGYNNNKFNQYISDRIPMHRRSWDTRPVQCLKQRLTPIKKMPNVSVLIIFYNEARSTLLRTAWSVLDRSPPELIHEILLVDDGSAMEHLHDALQEEVDEMPDKVKLIRLGERQGLIRAKVEGVKHATGEVLAFMDSHCEVNDGWLEPLLDRLVQNPKSVVCPVIDAIDADTFQIKEAIVEMGAFTWGLNFYWLSPPHTKHDREAKTATPFKSPAMAGGIFAMRRDYFHEVGEYDEGMDTWGGENFEMSFRVWMCGGTIENVPCSHIAHVFRTQSPYKFKNKKNPHITIAHNLNRVAAVWMDDHAEHFLSVSPYSKRDEAGNFLPDVGDISDRVALRKRLKCKSFDWYMREVASYMYVPAKQNVHHFGRLRNVFKQECIYHEGNPQGDMILAVFRDCDGPVDRPNEGPESVSWYYTKGEGFEGQLRHEAEYGSRCLHAYSLKKNARISLARCYDQEFDDERLRWHYDPETLQMKVYNKPSGCLTASPTMPDQVILTKCKPPDAVGPAMDRQRWTFLDMPSVHDEL